MNSILNIDDVKGIFKIFYQLDLLWEDIKVNFCFLQKDEHNNIVKNQTWLPNIGQMLYSKTQLIHKETTVRKEGSPTMYKDLNSVEYCEGYIGKVRKYNQ